jgi:glutathione peroxidase
MSIVGEEKHPLYRELTTAIPAATGDGPMREKLAGYGMTPNPAPEVLWNFEKFLIGRDGEPVARFSPDTKPDDDALVSAIEKELFASE